MEWESIGVGAALNIRIRCGRKVALNTIINNIICLRWCSRNIVTAISVKVDIIGKGNKENSWEIKSLLRTALTAVAEIGKRECACEFTCWNCRK